MRADKKTVHDTGFAPMPRRLALAVSLALMAASGAAGSAGLGRLSVQSALGQPLRAEVEITALNRDEAATLSAKLSSPEAFRQSGLEFNAALSALRFSIERRPDGRSFVRISSTQPINEPFVDLLLELNWATGRFVREYTFLLDPPELRVNRDVIDSGAGQASVVAPAAAQREAEPAVAAAPAPASAPSIPQPVQPTQSVQPPVAAPKAAAAARAAVAAEPKPAAAGDAKSVTAPGTTKSSSASPMVAATEPGKAVAASAKAPETVQVRPGDTLGGIAQQIKPAEASLDQTVVSLYQANPQAFMGSINLLKAGARLIVPATEEIVAVDRTKARSIVLAQSGDFSSYRGRVADTARELPVDKAGQSAAGTVTAKVEDKAAASKNQDQLKISKSGAAPAVPGKSSTDVAAAQALAEQAVARDAALKESQSRVKVLEQNVADLKKLLELKNQQFADLQKQAEASKPLAAGSSKTPETPAPSTKPPAGEAPPAAAKIEVPLAKPDAAAPASEPKGSAAPQADAGPIKGDAAPKADATPKADAAPKGDAQKTAAAAKAPPPSAGFIDDLTANPLMLPGLGAILALGAGYGWYAMRRRRKVEKFEDSLIATEGGATNSLFGSTGGHTVDTSTSFASSTRNSGVEVQTTEVDPIAEAEVYIAYGRESQAEEILREALRKQPQRQAIRAKLLEICSGRKDVAAFGALAAEMYGMAGGQNEEWPKVVTMGLAIDPDNPLYSGVPAAAVPASEPAIVTPPSGAVHEVAGEPLAPVAAAPAVQPEAFAETQPMEEPQAPSELPTPEAVPSLDFDLDLEPTLAKAGQKLADSRTQDGPPESDLERAVQGRFDLPDLDLNEPVKPTVEPQVGVASSGLSDFQLDFPEPAAVADKAPEAAPAGGATSGMEPETELPPLGFDLGLPAATPAAAAVDDVRWQEMATKLDLASAYEEIGDKEGARELLDEVMTGGDAAQQQKARAMLDKIA